jgi:hypothetical protein
VHEAVEQGPLLARLLRRVDDDDKAAGQDLDVVRVAPGLCRPLPDIGIVVLCVGELAAVGEDHLCDLGGELAARVRSPGLDDDRPAVDRPGNIQRAAHRQELALVVEHMQPLRVEIDAVLDIADKRVVGPAFPQSCHHVEEFANASLSRGIRAIPARSTLRPGTRPSRARDGCRQISHRWLSSDHRKPSKF